MALDFVVAFVDVLAEVAAPGNVVESAALDPEIVVESVQPGIAAAAVLALDTALDAALGIVAAVESGLDSVVAEELEADRVVAVAPDPDIAVAVHDLPSVAAVPGPDTAQDDTAEAVTVADTTGTVKQNDALRTNNVKFAEEFEFAKCFTALRLLTWFC